MFDIKVFTKIKATLVFFLLVQPVLLHAETPDAAGDSVQAATDQAAASQHRSNRYNFPRWPEPVQTGKRERIPPPPPGPYMSAALSDFSLNGPSFGPRFSRADSRPKMMPVPQDNFNPGVPWPDNLRDVPNHWKPPEGYRFISPNPQHKRRPERAASYRAPYPPAYGYRQYYSARPVMRPDYRRNYSRQGNQGRYR